jgi:hypothetical protein
MEEDPRPRTSRRRAPASSPSASHKCTVHPYLGSVLQFRVLFWTRALLLSVCVWVSAIASDFLLLDQLQVWGIGDVRCEP